MAEQEPTEIEEPARRRPGRPSLSNEELLDKALDLFLEKGFAGTSIDAICAAASMAKRTVYARYGDKESLFKAALTRAIDDWIVPIERLREQESEDLETSLMRIGEILVSNVLGPAGLRLLRLTNSESVTMPEISQENVRRGTEPTLRYLAGLFRRRLGDENGEFPEAEEAAQAFLNIVVGGPASNAAWGMQMEMESVKRHTRYCVRLFLHGVLDEAAMSARNDTGQLRRLLRDAEDRLGEARARIDEAVRLVRD
ncbi:TetR/AcrR family transcriptional regulator [Novosphingobium mangrovi (ex Huang et al. 2023)]|uniref:TetR/AcrR family transcriptional regulator n=1 Tax=Novosphingobium mangrovi (ex Huang et al. 2023) TaxID=2976432 RepID=A0ABT2HZJ4_9SPHN|nr:TetR/AcrR family transcriptional regulator [Novosphingobium mangrovi (ex Huang et al. 2023)]MCT2397967.1 TetR/AcrR family transcriptional regulator [Novosphingobium mangrovi (ex Huang et al. 2023)]